MFYGTSVDSRERKKIMKKLILLSSLLIFLLSACNNDNSNTTNGNDAKNKKTATVVFPVTIDAFEQLKEGIKESVGDTIDLEFYSAEGDASKFETAVQSALLNEPDYFISIGTQITNTAFAPKFESKLNIAIAGAISSPELVDALTAVGLDPPRKREVAIISDSPKEDIYSLFSKSLLQFYPDISKVGIIYNESEVNSKGTALKTVKALEQKNIKVEQGTINNIDDVEKIVKKLILNGSEAVIIPHDKSAVTKASSIVKICLESGIPVMSLDDGTVKKDGVAIGVSVNYKTIGKLIGETMLKINDTSVAASQLPIIYEDKAAVYLNEKSFKQLELSLPKGDNNYVIY